MTATDTPLPSTTRGAGLKLLGLTLLLGAVSALLVPGGDQLTWLAHANSFRLERNLAALEQQFSSGNHSAATIGALARARLRHGEPDQAIELLRSWSEERPDDLVALQFLADLSRQAKRPVPLTYALEQLQRRLPAAQRQRELVDLYAATGTPRQQLPALTSLIDQFNSGNVADYLALAKLQAGSNQRPLAIRTLERMAQRFPQAMDSSVVTLQIKWQLAESQSAKALALARAWLQSQSGETATASSLGTLFSSLRRPDLAVQLLEPSMATPKPDPRLSIQWGLAMADAGRAVQALSRLEALSVPAASREDWLLLRVRLALASNQWASVKLAMLALGPSGISTLPPSLTSSLASAALSAGRDDVLQPLMPKQEVSFASQDPILAAQLALHLNKRAWALHWANLAAAKADKAALALAPAQQLQLARLFEQMAEPGKALASLRKVSGAGLLVVPLEEFARLHISLANEREGLTLLNSLAPSARPAQWQGAWALLATANGRESEVLRWLRTDTGIAETAALDRDVMNLAMNRKLYELALAAGERLVKVSAYAGATTAVNTQDLASYAAVLLAAGRAPQALTQLRKLRLHTTVDPATYRMALEMAWRSDPLAADELRRDTLARLTSRTLPSPSPSPSPEADVALLQLMGAHLELLSALEPWVLSQPDRWLGAYTESAQRAGQREALMSIWRRLAGEEHVASSLRTQIAFRLLESGDKVAAERTFRALAGASAPEDAVTRQLLYVWGPRPTAWQLDWLETRARAASGDTLASWLRLLVDRGGYQRVIKLVSQAGLAPEADNDGVLEVYFDAIQAGSAKTALAGALRDNAGRVRSAFLLARMGQLAAGSGDFVLQRQLLRQAVEVRPSVWPWHKTLGLLAYRAKDPLEAARELTAYNDATGGDADSLQALGEVQLTQGNRTGAQISFKAALASLEAKSRSTELTHSEQVTRAGLLTQLGLTALARLAYDALLTQSPQDDDVRADYVSMLLTSGDLVHAKTLLAKNKP